MLYEYSVIISTNTYAKYVTDTVLGTEETKKNRIVQKQSDKNKSF